MLFASTEYQINNPVFIVMFVYKWRSTLKDKKLLYLESLSLPLVFLASYSQREVQNVSEAALNPYVQDASSSVIPRRRIMKEGHWKGLTTDNMYTSMHLFR